MYYATKAKTDTEIWWISKTLKGFLNKFKEEDELLVCTTKPSKAMYGYYYKIVDGKVKRHPNKAVNVMWLAREVGL